MAVSNVHERFQARRSSYRDGKMVHTRKWIVTCDDIQDGTAVALTGVPGPGARHNKDTTAILTGLEASPHENNDKIFLVQGEYTTLVFGLPADPLKRKPTISYGSTEFTTPYFLDKSKPDPKPVVNSSGDSFESFLEHEDGELTLTITVNEATFSPVAMDDFKHTKNLNAVTIDGTVYAAGTLKLSPPTATKVTESVEGAGGTVEDFVYYSVTYVLKAKKDGWDDVVNDVGLSEFIPDPSDPKKPGKLRPIVDATKLPIKKPWPLDGTGKKKTNPGDTPATLTFVPYAPVDWSALKPFLPTTWAA
jgi:hypothetical protein